MLTVVIALQVVALIVLAVLLLRRREDGTAAELAGLRELVLKMDGRSRDVETAVRDEMRANREESAAGAARLREENAAQAAALRQELDHRLGTLSTALTGGLETFRNDNVHASEALRGAVTQQVQALRENTSTVLADNTQKLTDALTAFRRDLSESTAALQSTIAQTLDSVRQTVEQRLDRISETNAAKLEEMRQTVDEKLHSTLERRLTESFGLVTDQLGKVQTGLGEMRELATGVGDLKRVLTNVKMRGGFAEVQLGIQLEQMLTPQQFIANARIKPGTQEAVEFAIRLPNGEDSVLLPIDAKFPKEDWERLQDAQERADADGVREAGKALENAVRFEAKKISDKYISPPLTTNFAVMYLPTEGLFAEVLRRPGLIDDLQTKFRVCVAGPTTLMALLTSLQMGFRTLAIQQKSTEVWQILSATKVEFENFAGLMTKVERQVTTVQNTLGEIGRKTGTINRTLKKVDTLEMAPATAATLLGLEESEQAMGAAAE